MTRIEPTQGQALQLSLDLQFPERTWTHQETYLDWHGTFNGQGSLIEIHISAPDGRTAQLQTSGPLSAARKVFQKAIASLIVAERRDYPILSIGDKVRLLPHKFDVPTWKLWGDRWLEIMETDPLLLRVQGQSKVKEFRVSQVTTHPWSCDCERCEPYFPRALPFENVIESKSTAADCADGVSTLLPQLDDSLLPQLDDSITPHVDVIESSLLDTENHQGVVENDANDSITPEYRPAGTARTTNQYFRYSCRVNGKVRHFHISGGPITSPLAIARWAEIQSAKARKVPSSEIVKMIESWA